MGICVKIKNILKNEAYKSSDVNVLNLNLNSDEIGSFVEGILLGNYKFDKYKTKVRILKEKKLIL